VPCRLPARAQQTFAADALLDGFHDLTHAYRFGPPQHDLVVATLLDEEHRVLSEAFFFVRPREPALLSAIQLEVEAEAAGEGCYQVALRSDHFLQGVSFDVKGFLPDDNYFHLPPSRRKVVRFRALWDRNVKFRAQLEALNLKNPLPIRLKEPPR
jgi:beta-mannosidase